MLTQQHVSVASIGETVTLEIGNWRRTMGYEVALLLSWWMQKHAREARRWAGNGFSLRLCGVLQDAQNPDAGQPFNPLKVRAVHADLIRKNQISVRREGDLVAVAFGADEMKMPYKAATVISQWVRLRAKESKRRAGDVARPWSAIGLAHEANHGPDVTRG